MLLKKRQLEMEIELEKKVKLATKHTHGTEKTKSVALESTTKPTPQRPPPATKKKKASRKKSPPYWMYRDFLRLKVLTDETRKEGKLVFKIPGGPWEHRLYTVYVCLCVCVSLRLCVCMCVCVNMCVYVYICICICIISG